MGFILGIITPDNFVVDDNINRLFKMAQAMKKESIITIKKKQANKGKKQASFDWLLFAFIAFVIILLVFAISL